MAALLWPLSAGSTAASAQVYVVPFAAAHAGGRADCVNLRVCEDGPLGVGVDVGWLGPRVGFEGEVSHRSDAFGKYFSGTPVTDTTIVMGNALFVTPPRRWRVFWSGGAGIAHTHTYRGVGYSDGQTRDTYPLALSVGGGAIVTFGHIGVRADAKYIHVQDTLVELGLAGSGGSTATPYFRRASIGAFVSF